LRALGGDLGGEVNDALWTLVRDQLAQTGAVAEIAAASKRLLESLAS